MAVQQNKKSPSKRGMHRAHNALPKPGTAIEPSQSNGSGAGSANGTMEAALRRMTNEDPELAARMILHSLPAAAAIPR